MHHEGSGTFRDSVRNRRQSFARSGLVTSLGLLLILGVVAGLWIAHVHGRIHHLTTTEGSPESAEAPATPGGREIMHLQRSERMGMMAPEFTSATLLPGDGLMLVQATLKLPGRADVPLLLGTKESALVSQSLDNVQGATLSETVATRQGSHWSTPVEMLAGQPSSSQTNEMLPDGSRARALFNGAPPAGTSQESSGSTTGVQTTAAVALTSRGLEVTVSAKNVSSTDRAVAITWSPRFLAPANGLGALTLLTPSQETAAGSKRSAAEEPLGHGAFDRTYVDLKHSYLDSAPEVRLRNDADGYTLHIRAMTPTIRSARVAAAAGGNAVLVAVSSERGSAGEDAPTVLKPGETLEWGVRVEATTNQAYEAPAP